MKITAINQYSNIAHTQKSKTASNINTTKTTPDTTMATTSFKGGAVDVLKKAGAALVLLPGAIVAGVIVGTVELIDALNDTSDDKKETIS